MDYSHQLAFCYIILKNPIINILCYTFIVVIVRLNIELNTICIHVSLPQKQVVLRKRWHSSLLVKIAKDKYLLMPWHACVRACVRVCV